MYIYSLLSLFVNPFLIKEFTPIKSEINKQINYTIPLFKTNLLTKVNGFYGQIGPNPMYYNNTDDYHLFDGNGMIQGVFINNSKITFTNHWVRTEKFEYEKKTKKKIPIRMDNILKRKNILLTPFYILLNKLNMFPNYIGTANTALWQLGNNFYALHERDNPYQIGINFINNTIETVNKVNIKGIEYFTAHPKKYKNFTYFCSYNTFRPVVEIHEINENLEIVNTKLINTKYVNMVHDIVVTNDYIIFIDMPFQFNINNIFNEKMPFYFDKKFNNSIVLVNRNLLNITTIECNESFFAFHYDTSYEDTDNIYINLVMHNDFDLDLSTFKNTTNYSKYRKLVINKKTFNYYFEKNSYFEDYNLEFPVSNNIYSVLTIFGDKLDMNGFMIIKDFKCKKKHLLFNRKLYAEPSITNTNCVICFTYDDKFNNYLYVYDIDSNTDLEIKLDINLIKGFHSIFIKN